MQAAKAFAENFDPELVVFFGTDHRRALSDLVPPFTIFASASGYGDWNGPTGPYDVAVDQAKELASRLLAKEFDVAVGHDFKLDHGFGQTWQQLFGLANARPIIPILVNCVVPPLPSLKRTMNLGMAVGMALQSSGKRILFLASGGLSHDPPLSQAVVGLSEEERERRVWQDLERAADRIRPEWDAWFLDALKRRDWKQLTALTDAELSERGGGAHEVRTWIAATAAANVDVTQTYYESVRPWITGMGIAWGKHAG